VWSAHAKLALFHGGSRSFRSFVMARGRRSSASAWKSESCAFALHMGAILAPMRKLAVLLVALAIAVPSFAETSEQAITSLITRQAEAWNRGDLEGFMDGYLKSDELVFTSSSRVRRGWQVTFDAYKKRYGSAKETMGRLTFSKLEVHLLGDDAAWVLGRWDLAGPKESAGGIFTLVLRRTDGRWLVVHDHTSSDAAE